MLMRRSSTNPRLFPWPFGVLVLLASLLIPTEPATSAPGPVFNITDVTVTEGDSGTKNADFTVSLTEPSTVPVSVEFATVNGTATGGEDFALQSGTLVFMPGDPLAQTINVAVRGDSLDEGTETFTVRLANATGDASIGDSSGTGTIVDDDGTPFLSINDARVMEGENAVFQVSLLSESPDPVTVDFTTVNGTATAPEDYEHRAGTLVFQPGDSAQTITVPTREDNVSEAVEEAFTVRLDNPVNAGITDAGGQAVILDRDVTPSLSIDDVQVMEDGEATFHVSLFPPANEAVTVEFTTVNQSAVAPDDYESKAGLLVFSPGDREKTISIKLKDDDVAEPGQDIFQVRLANAANAQIIDAVGQASIVDDDVTPSLTITDEEVFEGDDGTIKLVFDVVLFPEADEMVTVEFSTANGSAISPDDYTNTAGRLRFSPGETIKHIIVPVVSDRSDEAPEETRFLLTPGVRVDLSSLEETFSVTLSDPVNARVADASGVGTIIDDDLAPVITVDNVIVREGDAGETTHADFVVTVFPVAKDERVTVEFSTVSQSAVAPDDYRATSGMIRFAAGQTTATVTVEINGDDHEEPDEGFAVNLASPQNATIFDGQAIGTIADDDLAPVLSISDATVMERNEGLSEAVFTVSLSKMSNSIVTVEVVTEDDVAITPDDYVATRGPLTLAPGETSLPVRVPIAGDVLEEPDETFFVRLVRGSVALADDEAVGIIVDDDAPAAPRVALEPTPSGRGYWLAASDGDVFPFGDATFLGSFQFGTDRGNQASVPNQPIVDMESTTTGRGYWLVAADGGIFAFGNARFLGSTGNIRLNQPVVGMVPTPSGLGYWLVATDGGVFAFGDAGFHGSTGNIPLNKPIVGMAATPSGGGYWLVASDGGVFAFGDARFFGSLGGRPLNKPIVGIEARPSGQGYWLVASDGGVFAIGDARFFGSTGAIRLLEPISGAAATPSGAGYWLVASDGGVFAFGDAPFLGSTGGVRPSGRSVPSPR
jgi:hypothetical protein